MKDLLADLERNFYLTWLGLRLWVTLMTARFRGHPRDAILIRETLQQMGMQVGDVRSVIESDLCEPLENFSPSSSRPHRGRLYCAGSPGPRPRRKAVAVKASGPVCSGGLKRI